MSTSVRVLWAKAEKLARSIVIDQLGPDLYEISWIRPHGILGEVMTHQASTSLEALSCLVCFEEEVRLIRAHGAGCPCDTCSCIRIDKAWAQKRKIR